MANNWLFIGMLNVKTIMLSEFSTCPSKHDNTYKVYLFILRKFKFWMENIIINNDDNE
jgi:hypothetical protein